MNNTVRKFFLNSNIVIDKEFKLYDNNFKYKKELDILLKNIRPKNINLVIADYLVTKDEYISKIKVTDIFGCDTYGDETKDSLFLEDFTLYHDGEASSGYLNRAVSMLNYKEDCIVEKLGNYNKIDPIRVIEYGNNSYRVVSGFHRYHAIKGSLIKELINGKDIKELSDKYKIEADIILLDKELTYLNCIIGCINTKTKSSLYYSNMDKCIKVYTRGDIILMDNKECVISIIKLLSNEYGFNDMINYYCNEDKEFKKYLESNFKHKQETMLEKVKNKIFP